MPDVNPKKNISPNMRRLYGNLAKRDFQLPGLDQFHTDLSDPAKLRSLHTSMQRNGFQTKPFAQFRVDLFPEGFTPEAIENSNEAPEVDILDKESIDQSKNIDSFSKFRAQPLISSDLLGAVNESIIESTETQLPGINEASFAPGAFQPVPEDFTEKTLKQIDEEKQSTRLTSDEIVAQFDNFTPGFLFQDTTDRKQTGSPFRDPDREDEDRRLEDERKKTKKLAEISEDNLKIINDKTAELFQKLTNTRNPIDQFKILADISDLKEERDGLTEQDTRTKFTPKDLVEHIYREDDRVDPHRDLAINYMTGMYVNEPDKFERTFNKSQFTDFTDRDKMFIIGDAIAERRRVIDRDVDIMIERGYDELYDDYSKVAAEFNEKAAEVKGFTDETGQLPPEELTNAVRAQLKNEFSILQGEFEDVKTRLGQFLSDDNKPKILAWENKFKQYKGVIGQQEQLEKDFPEVYKTMLDDIENQKEINQYVEESPFMSNVTESLKEITNGLIEFGTGMLETSKLGSELIGNALGSREWNSYLASDVVMESVNGFVDQHLKFRTAEKPFIEEDGSANWDRFIPKLFGTATDMFTLIYGGKKFSGSFQKMLGKSTKITQRAGLFTSSFILTYDDYKNEALAAGLSQKEAVEFGTSSAALTSVLEFISPNSRWFKGAGVNPGVKSAVNKLIGGKKVALGEFVRTIGLEPSKEVMQELTQLLGDVAVRGMTNRLKGEDVFDTDITEQEVKETIILTIATTALLGGSINLSNRKEVRSGSLFVAAKNIDAFEKAVKVKLNNGDINFDQANDIMEEVRGLNLILEQIPSELADAKKLEISSLLVEKNRLEAENGTVDRVFQEKNNNKITEIQKEIADITARPDPSYFVNDQELTRNELSKKLADTSFKKEMQEGSQKVIIENDPILAKEADTVFAVDEGRVVNTPEGQGRIVGRSESGEVVLQMKNGDFKNFADESLKDLTEVPVKQGDRVLNKESGDAFQLTGETGTDFILTDENGKSSPVPKQGFMDKFNIDPESFIEIEEPLKTEEDAITEGEQRRDDIEEREAIEEGREVPGRGRRDRAEPGREVEEEKISVKTQITQSDRQQLADLGFAKEDVAKLKPQQAADIIDRQLTKDQFTEEEVEVEEEAEIPEELPIAEPIPEVEIPVDQVITEGVKTPSGELTVEKATSTIETAINNADAALADQVNPTQTTIDGKLIGQFLIDNKELLGEEEFNRLKKNLKTVVDKFKAIQKGDLSVLQQKDSPETIKRRKEVLGTLDAKQAEIQRKLNIAVAEDLETGTEKVVKKIMKATIFPFKALVVRPTQLVIKGINQIQDKLFDKAFDKIEEAISKSVLDGLNSRNFFLRNTAKFMTAWSNGLPRTAQQLRDKLKLTGGINLANENMVQFMENAKKLIADDGQSMIRVHKVLDPDLYKEDERITIEELNEEERTLHDLLRETNEFIHEYNFAMDLIPVETYDKFKGKYIARAYEAFEIPDDIKDFMENGHGSFGRSGKRAVKLTTEIFKARKEIDDFKLDNKIQDPIYLTAKRMMQTEVNMAIHGYIETIIDNPKLVTDEGRAGFTQLNGRGYGKLNGKFVVDFVAEDFKGFHFSNSIIDTLYDAFKIYDRNQIRQFFKKYHTVFSPAVQLGNATSNIVFAWGGGLDPVTFTSNVPDAIKEINRKGSTYKFLVQNGILSSDVLTRDLKPFTKETADEFEDQGITDTAQLKANFNKNKKRFGKILNDDGTLKSSKNVGKRLKGAVSDIDQKLVDIYRGADDVAKVAAYLSFRRQGIDAQKAMDRVFRSFQNYATVGKLWDFASKTPIIGQPFVKFQADLQRIVKNNVTRRPLNTAAFLWMLKALALVGSQWSDEDEELKQIREGRKFIPKVPLPEFLGGDVPLVFNTPAGEINIARFLSPFYIYDLGDAETPIENWSKFMPYQLEFMDKQFVNGLRLPAPKVSDPFLGTWWSALVTDRDFRNKSIRDPEATKFKKSQITDEEATLNTINFIMRGQLPWYEKVNDLYLSSTYGTDFYGRDRTPGQIAASTFLKIQDFGDEQYAQVVIRDLSSIENDINNIESSLKSVDSNIDKKLLEAFNKLEDGVKTADQFGNIVEDLEGKRESRKLKLFEDLANKTKELEDRVLFYQNILKPNFVFDSKSKANVRKRINAQRTK